MAISWDNIGRMANVAQLVGTDPISLVNAVITNVSDARTHRKVCKRFVMQLEVIRNLLELLNMSELNNYPWRLRRPLAQLEGTLQRSFDLVNSCKNHNYLYLLLLGRSIARQFKRAQSEIEMHLISIIPLIILMDNQRLREALSSLDENQNENMDEGSREMHDGNTSVSQTNPSSGEVHRTEEETLYCTEDNQNGNSLGEEIREVHDGIPDSVVVNPNENDLIEEIMEMHNGNTLASEDSSFSQEALQTKNKEILYGTNGNRSKSILDEEIREKQDGSTSGSYKNLFSREFHQTEKKVPRRKFQRLHTKVFGFWRIKNRNCGTANQLLMANNRIMELGISDAFLRIFTVQELEEAMNNFRYENPIAEESSGNMYLGSVRNNSSNPADGGSKTDVAIKIWKSTPSSEFLNWRNEVNTLGRMLHPNIIKLLGCCMEDEKLFTVYEFMEHGTLYDRLFGSEYYTNSFILLMHKTFFGGKFMHETILLTLYISSLGNVALHHSLIM
ncbi:protein MID1-COMPLEMENTING ACTIVITY 1-like isoform X3 [Canna indica]|uniref:Protein MID1-COMPLEMENTING ACTIVITY 1-like isoform X3 n=1 Tax=Canna indica TaxID=4628 RepID=A0AAQ3QFC4_9LILI|nr:protein MID1-COMPLEMENTING ACTIVITY 1-like isoform X3 [Canna indica]